MLIKIIIKLANSTFILITLMRKIKKVKKILQNIKKSRLNV